MEVTKETKAVAAGVVNYLEKYPERHNQTTWFRAGDRAVSYGVTDENICGTTMCIAGATMFLTEGMERFTDYISIGNDARDWERDAGKRLGLHADEAHWLFHTVDNDVALEAVKAIADGDVDKFQNMYERF